MAERRELSPAEAADLKALEKGYESFTKAIKGLGESRLLSLAKTQAELGYLAAREHIEQAAPLA